MSAARTGGTLRWDDPPEVLALLGRAVAVGIGRSGELDLGRGRWLSADPQGGILVIGPDSAARRPSRPVERGAGVEIARNLRREFHGSTSRQDWEIEGFPTVWDHLGPARTIVYESAKTSGGGDGKTAQYVHEFSPGARAYAAGDFLAILGEKIRVDASGVRN